jgi:hypothetical protein
MAEIKKLTSDVYAAGKTFGKSTKILPTCVAAIEALKADIPAAEFGKAVDSLRDAFYQGTLEGGLGLSAADAKAQIGLSPKERSPEATRLLDVAKVQWSRARDMAGLDKKRETHEPKKRATDTSKKRSGPKPSPATPATEPPVGFVNDIEQILYSAVNAAAVPTFKNGVEADEFARAMIRVFAATQEKNAQNIPADSVFMRVFNAMQSAVEPEPLREAA